MFFADGVRQVDYIVAFTVSESSAAKELEECFVNLLHHGVDFEVSEEDIFFFLR